MEPLPDSKEPPIPPESGTRILAPCGQHPQSIPPRCAAPQAPRNAAGRAGRAGSHRDGIVLGARAGAGRRARHRRGDGVVPTDREGRAAPTGHRHDPRPAPTGPSTGYEGGTRKSHRGDAHPLSSLGATPVNYLGNPPWAVRTPLSFGPDWLQRRAGCAPSRGVGRTGTIPRSLRRSQSTRAVLRLIGSAQRVAVAPTDWAACSINSATCVGWETIAT